MSNGVSIITGVLPSRSGFLGETATSVRSAKELFAREGVDIEWQVVVDGPGSIDLPTDADNVVRLPAQSGVAMSRNLALARAANPWIFPLDADDLVVGEGLWNLYEVAASGKDLAWVAGNRVLTTHKRTQHWFEDVRDWKPGNLAMNWTAPFPFHPNSVLFRRDACLRVGGWPAMTANEDLALVLKLSEWSAGRAIPDVVTLYRAWPGQSVASSAYAATKPLAFEILSSQINCIREELGRSPVQAPSPGGAYGIRGR